MLITNGVYNIADPAEALDKYPVKGFFKGMCDESKGISMEKFIEKSEKLAGLLEENPQENPFFIADTICALSTDPSDTVHADVLRGYVNKVLMILYQIMALCPKIYNKWFRGEDTMLQLLWADVNSVSDDETAYHQMILSKETAKKLQLTPRRMKEMGWTAENGKKAYNYAFELLKTYMGRFGFKNHYAAYRAGFVVPAFMKRWKQLSERTLEIELSDQDCSQMMELLRPTNRFFHTISGVQANPFSGPDNMQDVENFKNLIREVDHFKRKAIRFDMAKDIVEMRDTEMTVLAIIKNLICSHEAGKVFDDAMKAEQTNVLPMLIYKKWEETV